MPAWCVIPQSCHKPHKCVKCMVEGSKLQIHITQCPSYGWADCQETQCLQCGGLVHTACSAD